MTVEMQQGIVTKQLERMDRLFWPKSDTPGGRFMLHLKHQVKAFVWWMAIAAAWPLMKWVIDPFVGHYFYGAGVLPFEQYLGYLQSNLYWTITVALYLVWVVFNHTFGPVAVHHRDRARRDALVNTGRAAKSLP